MHIDRYERYWIIIASATMGVFFAALVAGAVIFGVRPPEPAGFLNPSELENTAFAEPGLRDMGNGHYEVHMVGRMWAWDPAEITVPAGARVTFNVTSADVTHGMLIEHHNLNLQIVPGHITRGTVTFDRPGEYHYLCHEYCGAGHQVMYGVVIVEDVPVTALNTEE